MDPLFKNVSKIGLGCVTFGREIDENASFAMMDQGFKRGITFFDTASAYGAGTSETIVGNWLSANKPSAGSITVATKILPPYTSKSITESVAQSLRRLGTKTIDLLYLHNWHPTVETKSTLNALNNLVNDCKVLSIGASNFNGEQLLNAILLQADNDLTPFRFIQNNHNLAVSDLNRQLCRVCRAYEIDIVTYSPLGAGFLTGKHEHNVQAGSRFALVPDHQHIYFNEHARHRLVMLQKVAARTGYTTSHLALAWALHQKDVSSVLIGGRSPAHINQAFEALTFNEPDIFAELESAI